MSKKETNLERDKRRLLWVVSTFNDANDPEGILEAIIDLASTINFEKSFPHVDRMFDGVYDCLDSMSEHIFALEDRVDELEKQIV